MVERQDIDALLIGALYGELTPADEKRLAAHLESHPADKALFADLTHARELVRESRILQVQHEPPKQISTLLVQEAARRAPREEKDGWFARFVRAVVGHPAMAAAMMLVVVIGFAAIVTQRGGDHFAGSEESVTAKGTSAAEPAAATPTTSLTAMGAGQDPGAEGGAMAAEPAVAEEAQVGAASDHYAVTLDEGTAEPAPTRKQRKPLPRPVDAIATVPAKPAPAKKGTAVQSAAKKEDAVGALELRMQPPQPKDFDARVESSRRAEAEKVGRGAIASEAEAPIAPTTSGYASPPPPPPSAPAQVARDDRAPRSRDGGEKLAAAAEDKPVDPQLAWARQQHARVIAQVRAGNCQSAAALVVTLENRAPAYYAQHVASDRAIKECTPYIARAREQEAEKRAERARASQQRANEADAPAKPATKAP
jgi:hypothetical protein